MSTTLPAITPATRQMLIANATHYETAQFLDADPSRFMHLVSGDLDRETMAFLAASLSYGSRAQFMPKIEHLRQISKSQPYQWIVSGAYADHFSAEDHSCFYRLYTHAHYHHFLHTYQQLLIQYGSLHAFLNHQQATTAIQAIEAITSYFDTTEPTPVIPRNATSACKRLCMFLRWMVRSGSPVDLGLWADIIDRRSLIMPLDTHVLQQAQQLGLIHSRTASMRTAQQLTATLAQVFPNDPLRADFALFGYGVEHD